MGGLQKEWVASAQCWTCRRYHGGTTFKTRSLRQEPAGPRKWTHEIRMNSRHKPRIEAPSTPAYVRTPLKQQPESGWCTASLISRLIILLSINQVQSGPLRDARARCKLSIKTNNCKKKKKNSFDRTNFVQKIPDSPFYINPENSFYTKCNQSLHLYQNSQVNDLNIYNLLN